MAEPDLSAVIIKVYGKDGRLVTEFIKPPDPPSRWHLYLGLAFGLALFFPLFNFV